MNKVRGTRTQAGKLRGKKDHESHDISTTQLVLDTKPFFDCADLIDDYSKKGIVPDISLSTVQRLKSWGMKRLLKQGNPFRDNTVYVRQSHRNKAHMEYENLPMKRRRTVQHGPVRVVMKDGKLIEPSNG